MYGFTYCLNPLNQVLVSYNIMGDNILSKAMIVLIP